MTRSTPLLVALLLVAVPALAACGVGDEPRRVDGTGDALAATAPAPTIPAPTRVVVTIESSRYSMPDLDLRVGDTVRFEQLDPYAHTVTRADATGEPTFDSGELQQGESFEITFDRAGTFAYFCRIHPTMRGTVVVS